MSTTMENINISNGISETVILVAEDNDLSYTLLKFLLSRMKYKVIRALNGKEAVDIFLNNSEINLILMDISMPVMDGIEAIRQIRGFDKEVPIIVQTAFVESSKSNEVFEAGCNAYLIKPIKMEELVGKIEECLKKNISNSLSCKSCG